MKPKTLDLEFINGKPATGYIVIKRLINEKYISSKCVNFSEINCEILQLEEELSMLRKKAKEKFPY